MKFAAAEKRIALAHTDFTQWHSVGPAAVGSAECWEDEVSWCTDSSVAAKHVMDNLALTHLLCVFVSLLSFHSLFSPILSSKVRQDTSWNTCCTPTLWLIDCLDIVLTAERPHVICPSSCSVNTLHFPLFPFSRRRCIYNVRWRLRAGHCWKSQADCFDCLSSLNLFSPTVHHTSVPLWFKISITFVLVRSVSCVSGQSCIIKDVTAGFSSAGLAEGCEAVFLTVLTDFRQKSSEIKTNVDETNIQLCLKPN